MRHARDPARWSEVRSSSVPNDPVQAKSTRVSMPRIRRAELALQRCGLAREQRVALRLVGKLLVLAAADDAPVGRGAQHRDRDRTPPRSCIAPATACVGCGTVAIAQVETILCPVLRHRSLEIRSRWRRHQMALSGCVWPLAAVAMTRDSCADRPSTMSTGAKDFRTVRRQRRAQQGAVSCARGSSGEIAVALIAAPPTRMPKSLSQARAGREGGSAKPAAQPRRDARASARRVEHVAGEIERVAVAHVVGTPSSPSRAAMASTASRERRQARIASRLPIRARASINGVSISYCTSAVLAVVEPLAGPRRSTTTTSMPSAESASATIAPVMPAPITSTSVSMSRVSRRCGTGGARRCLPDRAAGAQIL